MNARKTILVIGAIVLVSAAFFCSKWFTERADEGMTFDRTLDEEAVIPPDPLLERVTESGELESVPTPPAVTELIAPKTWAGVFFVPQSPTGDWSKSEFQDGCEEASALMIHAWRTGTIYTKDEMREELFAMARYEEKQIGQGVDTDVTDTAEMLLDGYFYISDYRIAYDFTLDELKSALAEGLVVVPTNGRALKNPNFTPPGPLQHMLVVTGYDAVTKEFITNDPGTRKGEGYRYPEGVLFDAIREYPTGKHLPITTERKAMIVVPSASNPASVTP